MKNDLAEVYVTLAELIKMGLIQVRDDSEGRQVYTLTEKGQVYAKARAAA